MIVRLQGYGEYVCRKQSVVLDEETSKNCYKKKIKYISVNSIMNQ